jgi:hypothetical protein
MNVCNEATLEQFVVRLAERARREKATAANVTRAIVAYRNLATMCDIPAPVLCDDLLQQLLARYHRVGRRLGGGIYDAPGTPLRLIGVHAR